MTQKFAMDFRCCKYIEVTQAFKIRQSNYMSVETVNESSCFGDRMNAQGVCEVAVTFKIKT